MIENELLLRKLPAFFRSMRANYLDEKQIRELVAGIKKINSSRLTNQRERERSRKTEVCPQVEEFVRHT
jgi:hypothetical protein